MTRHSLVAVAFACAVVGACESHKNNSALVTNPSANRWSPRVPGRIRGAGHHLGKGVGPVDHVHFASLDESRELSVRSYSRKNVRMSQDRRALHRPA